MTVQKPLMLKDYLELDPNTESSDGFFCYPRLADPRTVGQLLSTELHSGGMLVRTKSRGALTKISAAIKLRFLPSSKQQDGFLSRSFSKKLRGSFWKRRFQEEKSSKSLRGKNLNFEDDIDERRSFDYPSPVVSSFRSWFETDDSSGSDFLSSSVDSSQCHADSPARKESSGAEIKAGNHEETKVLESGSMRCQLDVEEKEQRSPVSVMDFPYEEEEEEDDLATSTTASPSFLQSVATIERTKLQILQKIRRFERLAELEPLDLEERDVDLESSDHVASGWDDEESCIREGVAWDLLSQLNATSSVGTEGSFEKLLVDFFFEGLVGNERRCELLDAARDWVNGDGCRWELAESRGEFEIREMERNGRWRCFEEEKGEVTVDLECIVLESLVEELASELLVS